MENDLKIIRRKTVKEILLKNPDKVYESIKNAYLLHESKQTHNPGSYFLKPLQNPGSRIIALPAYIGGNIESMGIKWIGSNPENIHHNLPRASATIILNDTKTMRPVCCMEGSIISAGRTAVSTVLATEVLQNGKKEADTLGIIGNGFIPEQVVHYFKQYSWKFSKIYLYDKQQSRSREFVQRNPFYEYEILNSFEELIEKSSITLFTTTAAEPYFNDLSLIQHNPILLNISLRDIGVNVILNSLNIVDDIDHVLNANTSVHLAEKEVNNRTFITGTLANSIESNTKFSNDKPVIFSPMGLGVLDIALAQLVYTSAIESGDYLHVEDF